MIDKTVVHVSTEAVRKNHANGSYFPAITVVVNGDYETKREGHEAALLYKGEEIGRFIYRPHDPLEGGARLWFETTECEVVPEIDQRFIDAH